MQILGKIRLVVLLVAFGGRELWGVPVYTEVSAQEVRARHGVGNVIERAESGREVTVAYLGGSITAMSGWRNKTTAWLRSTWPTATFKEIHAAIGGTGSGLGVFRLQHDVLEHKPDLLFVEFATNDGGAQPAAIWRNMEGIVRQTWRANPRTDIVFTYTITTSMTNSYCKGFCNGSAAAMEQLAEYYGIGSINFGPRVVEQLKAGKLMMDGKEIETAVPKDAPEREREIKERLAADGRVLFARDGVHPSEAGHELYGESMVAGLSAMRALLAVDHGKKLDGVFVADHLEAAKMVPISAKMLSGEWQKLSDQDDKQKAFGARMGQIWLSETAGSKLCFTFKGRAAKVYDLLGPDGGQVEVSVNGRKTGAPIARFDSYCTYHRIATLGVVAEATTDSVYEVVIELHPEQPKRESVAFRLKDPESELKSAKYQGTRFWASQLLLVGDLIEKVAGAKE